MKRTIVVAATLLLAITVEPVGAEQPAGSARAAYINPAAPAAVVSRPPASGIELPILGLVVSGLLYGAGRVWGR